MVDAIVAASPGRQVLDVGCGTGIAARLFEAAGCDVLGVEVDERMAAFARTRGLDVEVARFEDWDPAGRSFDAVIAGQTWHWTDPAVGASKAREALRPDGRVPLFWNVFDPEPELRLRLSAIYREVMHDWDPWARRPLDAYARILERAAAGLRAVKAFGELEQWRFAWQRHYDRDEWLEAVASGADTSRFSRSELDRLLARLGDAIDAMGGAFDMRYATVVLTTRRSRQ